MTLCPICDGPLYEPGIRHDQTWCAGCCKARHTDRKLKAMHAITMALPDEQARLNAELRFMRSLLIDRFGFSDASYWEEFLAFLRAEHVR